MHDGTQLYSAKLSQQPRCNAGLPPVFRGRKLSHTRYPSGTACRTTSVCIRPAHRRTPPIAAKGQPAKELGNDLALASAGRPQWSSWNIPAGLLGPLRAGPLRRANSRPGNLPARISTILGAPLARASRRTTPAMAATEEPSQRPTKNVTGHPFDHPEHSIYVYSRV